jgi:hypothetical protein
MFFGGWLDPDVASTGVAGAEVTFNKEVDCAAMGAQVVQAISVPTKRQFKAFWTGISSLRFNSPARTDRQIDKTILYDFGQPFKGR